jgi:starch synthase
MNGSRNGFPGTLADETASGDDTGLVNIAVQFEPDAFTPAGRHASARQALGNGFLRALIAGLDPALPLIAATPDDAAAAALADMVGSACAGRMLVRLRGGGAASLRAAGTLYVPGPHLAGPAAMRERVGADAYSLLGVVHGLATHRDMDAIAALATAPVMPWDALVSPSVAVRDAVVEVLEAEIDRLRQRLGAGRFPLPQLPVVPPGVDAGDFAFGADARAAARARLGLAEDAVALLAPGRRSASAPGVRDPLDTALAALMPGAAGPICLITLDGDETDMAESAGGTAAGVPVLRLDGRNARDRQHAFAAADVFLALAHDVEEATSQTLLAGMAAGLPVIATDWNGHGETIRDGVDGFLIPTAMPAPGAGAWLARRYQGGDCDRAAYAGTIAATVALDGERLLRALQFLCGNPALRREMGTRGQRLARAHHDWPQILRQYLALAEDLRDQRRQAAPTLPKVPPARQDPFRLYAGHATFAIDGATELRRLAGRAPPAGLASALAAATTTLNAARLEALFAVIPEAGFAPLTQCAGAAGIELSDAIIAAAGLAQAGGIIFRHAGARRATPAVDLPRVQPPVAGPEPYIGRRAGSA